MTGIPSNQSELHPGPKPLPDAEQYARLLGEARSIQGVSLWKDAWRRLRRNVTAMVSLGLLIAIAAGTLLTPLFPLQSPVVQKIKEGRQFLPPNLQPVSLDLTDRLESFDERVRTLKEQVADASGRQRRELAEQLAGYRQSANPINRVWHQPSWLDRQLIRLRLAVFGDWCIPSICGTDHLGRDTLARLFWGGRVSLMVGIVATFVSLVIGVTYGATAGYAGGTVDNLMMRLVDVMYSIPFIFVVIFIITILSDPKIKGTLEAYGINQIVVFYVLIGAIYWLTMARVVRGQVISLKNEQFIEAARTVGASQGRIIFRHLIPNVMSVVIVYLTLTIPAVMLFEAFLSFLGLGVTAPDVSWGMLANEGIKVITPVRIYWWLIVFPGVALAATLFALNFLGDGLRDALDPQLKNR